MTITCLKCGDEEQGESFSPTDACPRCGAIYAKVEAALQQARVKGTAEASPTTNPSSQSSPASLSEQMPSNGWYVVVHKDGQAKRTLLRQMFVTHGPYLLNELRLDRLNSAEVIRDASTKTAQSKSEGTVSTSVGSQIGRGIVGAAIVGPVGAIIGGSGASQKTSTNTSTSEKRLVDIYMALSFRGGESIIVEVLDDSAFKLFMASAGQEEWSPIRLEAAKQEAENYARASSKRDAALAQKESELRQGHLRWSKFWNTVGMLLVGLLVLMIGIGVISNFIKEKPSRTIDNLLAKNEFDAAIDVARSENDIAKIREINTLKKKAASKACYERGLVEYGREATALTSTERQDLSSRCYGDGNGNQSKERSPVKTQEITEGPRERSSIIVRNTTFRVGDLADSVFEVLKPAIASRTDKGQDPNNPQSLLVTHHYEIDGASFSLTFARTDDPGPYRLVRISSSEPPIQSDYQRRIPTELQIKQTRACQELKDRDPRSDKEKCMNDAGYVANVDEFKKCLRVAENIDDCDKIFWIPKS